MTHSFPTPRSSDLLILDDGILLVFGVDPYCAYHPIAYLGSAEIGGILRDVYSLSLSGLAAVVGSVLWLALTRTRWGMLLSTVIHDREQIGRASCRERVCQYV